MTLKYHDFNPQRKKGMTNIQIPRKNNYVTKANNYESRTEKIF